MTHHLYHLGLWQPAFVILGGGETARPPTEWETEDIRPPEKKKQEAILNHSPKDDFSNAPCEI